MKIDVLKARNGLARRPLVRNRRSQPKGEVGAARGGRGLAVDDAPGKLAKIRARVVRHGWYGEKKAKGRHWIRLAGERLLNEVAVAGSVCNMARSVLRPSPLPPTPNPIE